MTSLRWRLFVLIAAMTVLVWASAAAWIAVHTRDQVQRVLDRRLVEAAGMVASLVENSTDGLGARPQSIAIRPAQFSRQLSCQIWSVDGRLLGRSSGAPNQPLADGGTGFSERTIAGERWRVYTIARPERGIRVSVGDNVSVRQGLIGDVLLGLLMPALVGLGVLAALIWTAAGTGLRPLRHVARQLAERDAAALGPIDTGRPTSELKPLVDAINLQFAKLEQLRVSERHFIASAAHELQTPLAGLRAHAQVAIMAVDDEVRRKSLASIAASVDRTSRLVQQLLDLARQESRQSPAAWQWVPLSHALGAIHDEFEHQSRKAGVGLRVDEQVERSELLCDEGDLLLALRNLVKNAIDHSPQGGIVDVTLERNGSEIGIAVSDSGPGIDPAEQQRVRRQFERGSNARGMGSGLGLSIVELVMEHENGRLTLVNQQSAGLRATLCFASDRFRISPGR